MASVSEPLRNDRRHQIWNALLRFGHSVPCLEKYRNHSMNSIQPKSSSIGPNHAWRSPDLDSNRHCSFRVVIDQTSCPAIFGWESSESSKYSLPRMSLVVSSSNLNLVKRLLIFSSSSSVQGRASRVRAQNPRVELQNHAPTILPSQIQPHIEQILRAATRSRSLRWRRRRRPKLARRSPEALRAQFGRGISQRRGIDDDILDGIEGGIGINGGYSARGQDPTRVDSADSAEPGFGALGVVGAGRWDRKRATPRSALRVPAGGGFAAGGMVHDGIEGMLERERMVKEIEKRKESYGGIVAGHERDAFYREREREWRVGLSVCVVLL
ncbi:BTB/POZ domain-containing protein [Senna tora]|uniref:BTB/POZ domain-containing protein n=1 Tax=Senna tora TaxID=362788 RepID=A0A835CFY6_9FABA|nr:BTB/POZ domain-containing protein [Senna tora]